MLLYNYFFLRPLFSLDIKEPTDIFTYAVFFVVALPTSYLAGRVRDEGRRAARSADLVSAMLAAAHDLYGAIEPKDVARVFASQMQSLCGQRVALFLASYGQLEPVTPQVTSADETGDLLALANATWRRAPHHDHAFSPDGARWTFETLGDDRGRMGVAAFEAPDEAKHGTLSAALRRQGLIALERALLIAERGEAQALRRSQKLHDAFLNSVSHDLRTPLTAILGGATTLIDLGSSLPRTTRKRLLFTIRDQAERLSRYVRDLLDMSKVESGALDHPLQPCDIRDILQSAIGRVAPGLGRRTIVRRFADAVSLVETVPALTEQAVVNILENAIAYSPDGSAIEVAAYEDAAGVFASIADDGPGVPVADRRRIFEKFQRLEPSGERPGERAGGSGLGLAIAKGFVEAFDGQITTDAHPSKSGARFILQLKRYSDFSPDVSLKPNAFDDKIQERQ